MPSPLLLRTVVFGPDGVHIEYLNAKTDLRKNGIARTQSVYVPRGSDYDDEIDEAEEAMRALLRDVLEDFDIQPAVDPEQDVHDALRRAEEEA